MLSKQSPGSGQSTIAATFLGYYLHHEDLKIIINAGTPYGFDATLKMPSMIICQCEGNALTLFLMGGAQPLPSSKTAKEDDRRGSLDSHGPFSQDINFY